LKKRWIILIFISVFVITMLIVLFLQGTVLNDKSVQDMEQAAEDLTEDGADMKIPEEQSWDQFEKSYAAYTDDIIRFLDAFMDLTYNCDYGERHYYDGADAFMTEECYSYYVPMQDSVEAGSSEGESVPYKSYLHGTDYYFSSLTANQAECLAFIEYSATGDASESQESLLLLSLIRMAGEWKISSIETLGY